MKMTLAGTKNQELQKQEERPSETELLVNIIKLQAQLNSKMFEFIRDYQTIFDYSRDRMLFFDGSGRKTHLERLRREVNELGATLGLLASKFTGENVYEKRDSHGRLLLHCNHCKKETAYLQIIDKPYGLGEAYIDGTERLICTVCQKDTIRPGDERLPKFNSIFTTK